MTLLDASGRPMKAAAHDKTCPRCGSPPKDHEETTGFGGHWTRLCMLCGYTLNEGRDAAAEAR